MSSDHFEVENLKLVIDNLNQEINSYTPWVSRKEIAAWSAITIFFGVMFSVIKYVLTNKIIEDMSYFELLTVLGIFSILIIIFSIIIFLFIHSQYSSIYDKIALTSAIQNIIFKLVDIKKGDSSLKKNNKNIRDLINKKYNKIRICMRDPNRNHVKRVLINLWIYRIFSKNEKRRLSTHEIQEALLYSTIIFLDIIFIVSVIFSVFLRYKADQLTIA